MVSGVKVGVSQYQGFSDPNLNIKIDKRGDYFYLKHPLLRLRCVVRKGKIGGGEKSKKWWCKGGR